MELLNRCNNCSGICDDLFEVAARAELISARTVDENVARTRDALDLAADMVTRNRTTSIDTLRTVANCMLTELEIGENITKLKMEAENGR